MSLATPILCQLCGADNPPGREYCARCHQKLYVISGPFELDEQVTYEEEIEESISFDEHLLERISVLEEALKRTAETVRQMLGALHKQERSILLNQTGLSSLIDLLEGKELIASAEWTELWESRLDYQLLVLDKRERFLGLRERIEELYQGDRLRQLQELLDRAERSLSSFDLDGAMEALEAAFKLDRGNFELASFLGETWFNEGEMERALPFFERALAAKPDHYEALIYSGVLHHERGRDARAQELLGRAVALYPDSFLPLFSLGAVHARRDSLKKAAIYLERAVAVEPVPQALYLLGNCLYDMGKSTAAIKHLKRAVQQAPAFEEAHHLLGLAYLDRRWTKKALDAFRQAQRLNPKKLQYRDLVRFLEGEAGRPLPEVPAEAADFITAGERSLASGDERAALTSYRRALDLAPENPTLLLTYALACLQLDRGQEIEAVTKKVLDAHPGEMLEATAYAALIEALRSQGRYREGNKIGRAMLSEGRSTFSKTIAYYEMAFNLAEMEEDLDAALDYARQSLELAPEELKAFPLAALGWVHYKRREFDQAVDFLSRSSELGPSTTTLTHLGMALLASGQEERARSVLAHARALDSPRDDLGAKMMEVMQESTRLLERVRARQKK